MQATLQLSLFAVLIGLVAYRLRGAVNQAARDKLTAMWWHYCWGCFSAGTNGAVIGVKGTLGVAAGAAFNPQDVQAPNLIMAGYVFLTTFIVNALDWFAKNPLPTDIAGTKAPFSNEKTPPASPAGSA